MTPPPVKPAQRELLDLAAAARSPEWAAQLEGALAAAAMCGWPWPRAALYACRLIFDQDGEPRELRDATRNPLERGKPADPDAVAAALADMRAAAANAARPPAADGENPAA